MRTFNTSPLPFQGQKRNFVKAFKRELINYPANAIFVDLFGGSGLLSNTVKQHYPAAKVVYNDYDDFMSRIRLIPQTNQLLHQLRGIVADLPRKVQISGKHRMQIIELLREAENSGYNDWITISSNLLFSMNYATTFQALIKETMYNKVRLSDYDSEGYLSGVEITRADYKELFESFKHYPNVVYLVDPPYLSTDTATYCSDKYWRLQDYLDVLLVLMNNNYFYFTSSKSQIVELCNWISSVTAFNNPFSMAQRSEVNVSTTHNAGYTDIMYHYKKNDE
ncbi:MAG: DNA adenine methylase [Bacteroidales bacterium]|nr:DNA adenine methylase [Bacteroidales bacterium]